MNYGHMSDDVGVPDGGFALLNTFVENGCSHRVHSAEFDPYEELLWTGNLGGCVVSHYSPAADKYTAVTTNLTGTLALNITGNSVISISKYGISGNRKSGLPLFYHYSHNLTNLSCIHPMPHAPQTVIVGGHQQKIVQFDIETQKEQRIVHLKSEKNCTIIRSNDKFIFTSDTSGNISLRNMTAIEAQASIKAHQGYISDFDICGNYLVTCGCSGIPNRNYGMDMFVKVWDLRTLKLSQRITLTFEPAFCRFIPGAEPKIVAVAHYGVMQVIDLNTDSAHNSMQIQAEFPISSLAVSPSRQCIAIGDQGGFVHLFSDRADPIFHENPMLTEFFQHEQLATHISITDGTTPLAIIAVPIADTYLSDDWPEQMTCRASR